MLFSPPKNYHSPHMRRPFGKNNEKEKIDCAKIGAFAFDQVNHGYYAIGEKVGKAWNSGSELMKKQ